ncbi:hypothetical protein VPH35_092521 [Triticum aestivum]
MVERVVERDHRFPAGDAVVAPCFPEDFIITLADRVQRDLVYEGRFIEVAGVKFQLRPWFPPPGGHKVWRFYCRVAIDRLPLNAWDWDSVQEVLGKNCWLDLIERQSTSKRNRSALFAWLWTWNPDQIPRASDFNLIHRPDIVRPRDSLPEGVPAEEGKEGPHFPVLIHLDVVKDYTPLPPSASPTEEWPRTYTHKGWRMGVKDGEGRTRAASTASPYNAGRRSDDDHDDGFGGGRRKRGKRGGARRSFWQGVRDQAQCRDTAAYAPAPRGRRRHVEGMAPSQVAICLPLEVRPQAPADSQRRQSPAAQDKVYVTPSLQVVQGERGSGSREQADHQQLTDEEINDAEQPNPDQQQRSDEELSDAHSLPALSAGQVLPPQELMDRARRLSVLVMEKEAGGMQDWGLAPTPGGLMQLFSPPRQKQLAPWASNVVTDAASITAAGVTSFFQQRTSYELPPLPPSLDVCNLSAWDLPPPGTPAMAWDLPVFSQNPCWLPSWAEMPMTNPSWASGPEVVLGPGIQASQQDHPPPGLDCADRHRDARSFVQQSIEE